MKNYGILTALIILITGSITSCHPLPGRELRLTATSTALEGISRLNTATSKPKLGTPVGWTGNEVQPQEYVYPSETAVFQGPTIELSNTPRPSTTVYLPTRTATATRTLNPLGPTLTPSRTPRDTPTTPPTATGTQQSGWTGTWVVYYGVDDNSLETGSMMVTLTGGNLSAAAQFGSLEMLFTGGLSQQDQEASGTYTHPTDPGWFYWKLVSPTQFGGVLNDEMVFCANRPGGQRPNPCGIHPSY